MLREPNVASAIVGASRPEQLDENAAASGLTIDPALFAKAEALVAGVERVGVTAAVQADQEAVGPNLRRRHADAGPRPDPAGDP